VGLAADCDSPEADVQSLMAKSLPGASMLPFAGFVTPELLWVGGFSGYKDEGAFLKVLDAVEKNPALDATDAVKKKLGALADRGAKAAEKGDWKSVLAAVREGAETAGRCPERARLGDLLKKARAWAEGRLASVVADVRKGGDLPAARGVLNEVKKQMAAEPEAADADTGLKALQRLSNIRSVEEGGKGVSPEGLREKAAREYAGTRWAAAFGKEAPAEAPHAPEPPPAPPKDGK
jgi:hypothetical protein